MKDQLTVLDAKSLSFSMAASIVTTLLQLASIKWPGAPTDFWWALAIATVVGAFIVGCQWPVPKPGAKRATKARADVGWWGRSGRDGFGLVGMGVLNVLLVTAAVLGVGSAVESEPVTATMQSSP
jgi:hypothetical protein